MTGSALAACDGDATGEPVETEEQVDIDLHGTKDKGKNTKGKNTKGGGSAPRNSGTRR